jgi:hypothetical protein
MEFIITDQRGNINIHNYNNGELVNSLTSHTAEISSLKLDVEN